MTSSSTPVDAELPSVFTPFDLRGSTALVTGASSGLGKRFAQVLAGAGATVWVAARRKERLDELAAVHPTLHPITCDVSVEAEREKLVTAATRAADIDILINNAATDSHAVPADESSGEFSAVLETNLVAPFHLAQLAVARSGITGLSVINISSILGLVSAAPLGGASYAAAKAGLIGLTRELAGHWGDKGVRVNALAPGWFRTELNDGLFDDRKAAKWIGRNSMLRRPGEIEELDGALLFLASPASSYVTGQVLCVDGGWTAR